MTTWIKIVVEVPTAFLILAGASSFWSLQRLPKYLFDVMRTPSNLDLLQMSQFTGLVQVDQEKEATIGYPSLLTSDIASSLSSWRWTKFVALAFCCLILLLSGLMGVWFFGIDVAVFFAASLLKVQLQAQGNVFKDVQIMLGRIDRWMASDPEACRTYCLQTNPKFFHEMFRSVERRR